MVLFVVALAAALFSPEAPVAAINGTPTVTVVPNTGLVDGQPVSVELTDFPPNTVTAFTQCVDTPNPLAGSCNAGTSLVAKDTDASGSVTYSYSVRRVIFTYRQGRVDCAQTACVIVAGTGPYGGPHIDAISAPLEFLDTTLPPPQFSIALDAPHFFNGTKATVRARLTCDRDQTVDLVFHLNQDNNPSDFTYGTSYPCAAGSHVQVFSEYFDGYLPGEVHAFAGVGVNGYVDADAATVTLQSDADTAAALRAALAGPDGDAVRAKLIDDLKWRITYNPTFATVFAAAIAGR